MEAQRPSIDTQQETLPPQPKVLIVVERRDFIRGCLILWATDSFKDFETWAVADFEMAPDGRPLEQAVVALIGFGRAEVADQWLSGQIELLRGRCPDVPVALLLEVADEREAVVAEALDSQAGVQGYITTSTNLHVAAAALRLIAAGGAYFPPIPHSDRLSAPARGQPKSATTADTRLPILTPREQAVLDVLASGAPNKIIAHRLGISLSTVKAHVHSIIRKLKVRNRTEALMTVRSMQDGAQHTGDHGVPAQSD